MTFHVNIKNSVILLRTLSTQQILREVHCYKTCAKIRNSPKCKQPGQAISCTFYPPYNGMDATCAHVLQETLDKHYEEEHVQLQQNVCYH